MTELKGHTQHLNQNVQKEEESKKSIFSEFSMPAVIAAALGSVASFMLASKLGVAGSLIGAGITSAVSSLTVQLSKPMITSSVEKIHDLSSHVTGSLTENQPTAELPGATQVRQQPVGAHARIAPADMRARAAEQHADVIKKRLILVAVAAAFASLVVYAAVVHIATQGQGIGPTPETIRSSVVATEEQATTQLEQTTSDTGSSSTDATATTQTTDTSSSSSSTSTSTKDTVTTDASSQTQQTTDATGDGAATTSTTDQTSGTGTDASTTTDTTGTATDATGTATDATSESGSATSEGAPDVTTSATN